MKTDINTFKAADLLATLAKVAPSISIETIWTHDEDCGTISKECDGFKAEDDDDWQAWQSEVRASAIVLGKIISGSSYLGGTFEKFGDNPRETNPEISGYLPQKIREALEELQWYLPPRVDVNTPSQIEAEITAALNVI